MSDNIGSTCESDKIGAKQFRAACDAAGIGIWEWHIGTGIIHYSDRARKIMGFTPDEPITIDKARAVTHPADLPTTHEAAQTALDPDQQATPIFTYRILRKDTGEERWVRAQGQAEFVKIGGLTQAAVYTGSIQDITDLERAQQAVRESEARLQIALSAANMAVWEVDVGSDKITTSPELIRLYEFPEGSTPTSQAFRDTYAPGELERLTKDATAAFSAGEATFQSRLRHNLPSGPRTFVVRAAYAPERETGKQRVIGVVYDISEQVHQERRLETIAQELRHRLKNMATLIGVIAGRMWPRDKVYDDFVGRLRAMSASTDLMFGGVSQAISLQTLLDKVIEPFRATGCDPFVTSGTAVDVPDKIAAGLALALHELATNAVKHGALRGPAGQVFISWKRVTADSVELTWRECGGPPISRPESSSFGMMLLTKGTLAPPSSIDIQFPEDGLVAKLHLVFSAV